jgi:hypothetical protein
MTGKATHGSMPLNFIRGTRPCKTCPDAAGCQWRHTHGDACGRFLANGCGHMAHQPSNLRAIAITSKDYNG